MYHYNQVRDTEAKGIPEFFSSQSWFELLLLLVVVENQRANEKKKTL